MKVIEIVNLKKKFENNQVLDGINLTINDGDIIGIIGPSGTGKSTLLRCINSLERAEEGKIIYKNKDASEVIEVNFPLKGENKKNAFKLRKKTGMVFQTFNLFEHRTALKNVESGFKIVQHKKKDEARKIALAEL